MTVPNQEKTPRREMEVEGGCTVCDGKVFVRFSRRRAVSVCKSCHHIAVARVALDGGNVVFEQIIRAAA